MDWSEGARKPPRAAAAQGTPSRRKATISRSRGIGAGYGVATTSGGGKHERPNTNSYAYTEQAYLNDNGTWQIGSRARQARSAGTAPSRGRFAGLVVFRRQPLSGERLRQLVLRNGSGTVSTSGRGIDPPISTPRTTTSRPTASGSPPAAGGLLGAAASGHFKLLRPAGLTRQPIRACRRSVYVTPFGTAVNAGQTWAITGAAASVSLRQRYDELRAASDHVGLLRRPAAGPAAATPRPPAPAPGWSFAAGTPFTSIGYNGSVSGHGQRFR